jgi:hypothetical protein
MSHPLTQWNNSTLYPKHVPNTSYKSTQSYTQTLQEYKKKNKKTNLSYFLSKELTLFRNRYLYLAPSQISFVSSEVTTAYRTRLCFVTDNLIAIPPYTLARPHFSQPQIHLKRISPTAAKKLFLFKIGSIIQSRLNNRCISHSILITHYMSQP